MKKVLLTVCLCLGCSSSKRTSPDIEPNNDKASANSTDLRIIHGSLEQGDPVDWFILNGQQGTHPTFTISHASTCDVDLEVYDNETLVARASREFSPDSISCYVKGRCFLRVFRTQGNGSYEIKF